MKPQHKLSKTAWLKILVVIFSLSFLVKLGSSPLLEIDEAIYAEIARESFVSGDYLSTHFNYDTEFSKPPLQYWLLQISYAIFGVNEWAVRLPSFIMAIGVLSLTYLFGRHIKSSSAGLWACLVLCATPGFYSMIRDARMDLTLTFFIALSIYGFYVYTRNGTAQINRPPPVHPSPSKGEEKGGGRGFFCIYVGMAGAILTKGPIGLILPILIISLFMLLRKKSDSFRSFKPFHGILLVFSLIAPWYIYMTWRYGYSFIEKNIIYENLRKFFVKGIYESNPGGHFFLSHTLLWYFFPWWIFWFYQHYKWIKDWNNKVPEHRDITIILLLWFYVPLVFFSLSRYSLPNYLSLIIPAASLGVGIYIESAKEKIDNVIEYLFSLFSIPLLTILFVSALYFFGEVSDTLTYLLIGMAVIFTSVILISGISGKFIFSKVGMILLVMITQLTVSVRFQPFLDRYKPAKPISEAIKKVSGKEFEIALYNTRFFQALVFYTNKELKWIGSEGSMLQFINSHGEVFVITGEKEYKHLPGDYKKRAEIIGRYPYFPVARINYNFLNPRTRAGVIDYILLTKIR